VPLAARESAFARTEWRIRAQAASMRLTYLLALIGTPTAAKTFLWIRVSEKRGNRFTRTPTTDTTYWNFSEFDSHTVIKITRSGRQNKTASLTPSPTFPVFSARLTGCATGPTRRHALLLNILLHLLPWKASSSLALSVLSSGSRNVASSLGSPLPRN